MHTFHSLTVNTFRSTNKCVSPARRACGAQICPVLLDKQDINRVIRLNKPQPPKNSREYSLSKS